MNYKLPFFIGMRLPTTTAACSPPGTGTTTTTPTSTAPMPGRDRTGTTLASRPASYAPTTPCTTTTVKVAHTVHSKKSSRGVYCRNDQGSLYIMRSAYRSNFSAPSRQLIQIIQCTAKMAEVAAPPMPCTTIMVKVSHTNNSTYHKYKIQQCCNYDQVNSYTLVQDLEVRYTTTITEVNY